METPTLHLHKQYQGRGEKNLILAYNSMLSIVWYWLKEWPSRANKDNKEVKLKSFVEQRSVVKFPRNLLHYTAETKDMIFIFQPLCPANSWPPRKWSLVSAGEDP